MGSGGSPLLFPTHSVPLPTIPNMRMHRVVRGLACWGLALPAGGQSLSGHLSPGPSPACPPRLLRSLVSLKQVIMNAAHYLVLGDKKAYHFDPEVPFLQMVSPAPASACGDLWCAGLGRELWCKGLALLFPPRPGVKNPCPAQPLVPIRTGWGLGRQVSESG